MGFTGAYAASFKSFDYHTETAGTAIDEEVPGKDGMRLALTTVNYLCGATAQNMILLYASDFTSGSGASLNTTSALALSGQKVINVTNTPLDPAGNAAAASDIIAFQLTDGTWEFDTIASVATKAITCTNNITGVDAGAGATAIASGGKVRIIGVIGDGSQFAIHLVAATLLKEENTLLAWHPYIGDPFYVTNANGTNDSFQNSLIFAYIENK